MMRGCEGVWIYDSLHVPILLIAKGGNFLPDFFESESGKGVLGLSLLIEETKNQKCSLQYLQ